MRKHKACSTGLRQWILDTLKGFPDGLSVPDLMDLFRDAEGVEGCCTSIPSTMHELAGTWQGHHYPEYWVQRAHIVGWGPRRDSIGRLSAGGKPTPYFAHGPGPNEPKPAPGESYHARYFRDRRAAEAELERADQTRTEIARRRALKRKPQRDPLTAALFGPAPVTSGRK